MSTTDKQIDKILQRTLKETNLNIKSINVNLMQTILDSSYNPVFTGTTWKIYKYLDETSKYKDNLMWIPSGNTIGFFKYNGHIPWDDDIDIGFKIHNNFDDYVTFLVECIKKGFIVNLHMMGNKDEKLNWYENDVVANLILDSTTSPSWSHIKESDFRKLLKTNPNKFHFGSVTIKEHLWAKICKKLDFTDTYLWSTKSIVTPWVDVIPYIKKDNKYISNINDNQKSSMDMTIDFEFYKFLGVPGKFPTNLLTGILHQYNENRSYLNFMHWDTIYSHVKKIKVIIDYNKEPELHKFVRAYVSKYNEELLLNMNKLEYSDIVN